MSEKHTMLNFEIRVNGAFFLSRTIHFRTTEYWGVRDGTVYGMARSEAVLGYSSCSKIDRKTQIRAIHLAAPITMVFQGIVPFDAVGKVQKQPPPRTHIETIGCRPREAMLPLGIPGGPFVSQAGGIIGRPGTQGMAPAREIRAHIGAESVHADEFAEEGGGKGIRGGHVNPMFLEVDETDEDQIRE